MPFSAEWVLVCTRHPEGLGTVTSCGFFPNTIGFETWNPDGPSPGHSRECGPAHLAAAGVFAGTGGHAWGLAHVCSLQRRGCPVSPPPPRVRSQGSQGGLCPCWAGSAWPVRRREAWPPRRRPSVGVGWGFPCSPRCWVSGPPWPRSLNSWGRPRLSCRWDGHRGHRTVAAGTLFPAAWVGLPWCPMRPRAWAFSVLGLSCAWQRPPERAALCRWWAVELTGGASGHGAGAHTPASRWGLQGPAALGGLCPGPSPPLCLLRRGCRALGLLVCVAQVAGITADLGTVVTQTPHPCPLLGPE